MKGGVTMVYRDKIFRLIKVKHILSYRIIDGVKCINCKYYCRGHPYFV